MLWLVINLINNNELLFCSHGRTQVCPHLLDSCPLSPVVVVFRCRLLSSVSASCGSYSWMCCCSLQTSSCFSCFGAGALVTGWSVRSHWSQSWNASTVLIFCRANVYQNIRSASKTLEENIPSTRSLLILTRSLCQDDLSLSCFAFSVFWPLRDSVSPPLLYPVGSVSGVHLWRFFTVRTAPPGAPLPHALHPLSPRRGQPPPLLLLQPLPPNPGKCPPSCWAVVMVTQTLVLPRYCWI